MSSHWKQKLIQLYPLYIYILKLFNWYIVKRLCLGPNFFKHTIFYMWQGEYFMESSDKQIIGNTCIYILCKSGSYHMLALHFCSFFYSLSIQQTFYSFVMSFLSGLSYFLLMSCSKKRLMEKRIQGGWLASLSHPVIGESNIFHPSSSTIPQMPRVLPWSQSIILPKQQSSLSQQHRRACANVFANLTNCQN